MDWYLLLCCTVFLPAHVHSKLSEDEVLKLKWKQLNAAKMDEKLVSKMKNIHTNFYIGAVRGLLGAVGAEIYRNLPPSFQHEFSTCLYAIKDEQDLEAGAKCVSLGYDLEDKSQQTWIGGFAVEEESNTLDKENYDEQRDRQLQGRFRRSPYRLRHEKNDTDVIDEKKNVITLKDIPNLLPDQAESPIITATKFFTQLVTGRSAKNADGHGWKTTSAKLDRLRKQLSLYSDIKNLPPKDEKFAQRRLFDIVTDSGNYHSKVNKKEVDTHLKKDGGDSFPLDDVPLVGDALKLVQVLSVNNISQSTRFLSPRIAPIMKQATKGVEHVLSPSLFSFYRDDSPNNIASLPEIMNTTGLNEHEQDTMMELAMEISGTRKIVDKLFDNIDNPKDVVGLSSDILSAMERISEVWTKFGSSYDDRQKSEIATKGYSFLGSHQIDMFYGKHGLYNYTNTDIKKLDFSHLTEEGKRNAMRATIRKIADGIPLEETDRTFHFSSIDHHHHRAKRQTAGLTPSIVLTPFAFAPTLVNNVILGSTILSPNIFSPFIVSLQVAAPSILSPSLGDPYIISPLVLCPFIVSPGVFLPFILTPYLFAPFILSPMVFLPFILSPYVLSPNIFNPYVFSPLILSPVVASPDVYSSTVLSGAVLSPVLLSPSIQSDYYLGVNVLSPTLLSRKKRNVFAKRRLERLLKLKMRM